MKSRFSYSALEALISAFGFAGIIVMLFVACTYDADGQTKFFRVESGDLNVPYEAIRAFVGEKRFTAVSEFDTADAMPGKSWKTNRVYGRGYADYRGGVLEDLFKGQVEGKVVVGLVPKDTAGLWITIQPSTEYVAGEEVNIDSIASAKADSIVTVRFAERDRRDSVSKARKDSIDRANELPPVRLLTGMAIKGVNNSQEVAWGGVPELVVPISHKSELSAGVILNGAYQGQGLITPFLDFATVLSDGLKLVIGIDCSLARNRDLSAPSPFRTLKNLGVGAGVKFPLGEFVEAKAIVGISGDLWMANGSLWMTNLQGYGRVGVSADPIGIVKSLF